MSSLSIIAITQRIRKKSVDLMLLCKYKVLEDIKLNANGRRELLSEFVKNDLSHYLDWVEKKEAEELRAKRYPIK